MVNSNLRRLMYFVLGLVLITSVLKCQVIELVWDRSVEEIVRKQQFYKAEITREELDSFIKLWPQFKKLGLADDLIISYRIDRPSKFVDWKTKVWFVYNKWDSDRFFYVQQRISYLLHTISVQRNAKAMIQLLEERDDTASKEMIDVQQQRYNVVRADENELQLVLDKEITLRNIID